MAKIDLRDAIYYKAPQEKAVVHVFFDPMCGYCRHLVGQLEAMNEKGITVELLLIANNPQAKEKGTQIWCSADRKKALLDLLAEREIKSKECETPIEKNTRMADSLSVRGTPAVFTEKGVLIGGYATADSYLKKLENLK